ncbi:MAG TPA: alanine racemase [Methanocorpusculum sp.]|nr:alanine racemase [Methanocorpusculum sp.]
MKGYIIDKARLTDNIDSLKARAGDVPIYAVIKGNGYGLGLIEFAKLLRASGIDRFAVTEIGDVAELRGNGFETEEILMLRATSLPDELRELLRLRAVVTISDPICATAVNAIAIENSTRFLCHIKIDTGMGRYGFEPDQIDILSELYGYPGLDVQGIYTHFHSAFCSETETRLQFERFKSCCDRLAESGLNIGIRHCCNSSAFIKYPEMYLDAVRIGSAFLGRLSFPGDFGLNRIGYCESQVEILRDIPVGRTVGYGAAWRAKRATKIAVTGIGYFNGFGVSKGDDLFRFRDCLRGGLRYVRAYLSRKAIYASVNGKPARVLGYIGMVQTILDVSDIPCKIGDSILFDINPLIQKNLDIIYK